MAKNAKSDQGARPHNQGGIKMIDKAREVALKTLYKIEKEDAFSNIALDELLKQNRQSLDERDVGLISEIVYGVTTWRLTLDEIIKKYSNIRLKKISIWILNILRMGVYQIIFLDKIPKSAAVNESVNLAKRYGHKSSSNFVNAILRKVEKTDYNELFDIENDIERISKTTSMPVWIIEELLKGQTVEEVEEICRNSNLKPEISIRVNNLKITKEELKNKLKERNIKFEDGVLEDFLVINKVKNIENLDLFKEGFFTIEDEGAGLIPLVLEPKQGDVVLDACSAPGGKTTYMAEMMHNEGEIEAWDIYEHRLNLVNQTAKRLGINIINTEINDATIYNEKYKEKFDKILLDVPCLGLGVLKRKPDIKWKRKREDIQEIKNIQLKILDNCSKYLKSGGEIVYSTCSILKQENEECINEFIKNNEMFSIKQIDLKNDNYFEKISKFDKYLQLYQNEKTDGFFICKLQKK